MQDILFGHLCLVEVPHLRNGCFLGVGDLPHRHPFVGILLSQAFHRQFVRRLH
jgi:hypothetical protein